VLGSPFRISEKPMKRSFRYALCIALVAAVCLVGSTPADDKKPKDEPKKLTVMQRKLAHSQKALEALATNNFDKLGAAADGLIACVEDATWKINETKKYLTFSNDFLHRAENLKKAAKDKNIDGAALAYVDMTLTCVKCHQYLREERIREVPDLSALAKGR
jgi:hypothetical protein